MTITFTLIFHLITRITQGRSLCLSNYVGVKGRKPWRNIFRASNVVLGFLMPHRLERVKIPKCPYTVFPSCSHFGVKN